MWDTSQPACIVRAEENAKLMSVLPQKLIDLESRRSRLRWHGYQFLSPLECTRQFAAHYRSQFASTFYGACDFDPEIGTPEFETLWEMRLAADECSYMSYRMYLEIAFHLFRKKDPEPFRRPHMFFANRQDKPSWIKQVKKQELWDWDVSKVAEMGEFQRFSYAGLPAQDKFRNWISNKAKSRGWRWTAERYVLQSPVWSPAELVAGLAGNERSEAVSQMKAIRNPIVRVAEKVGPEALIQTCFAWPRSRAQAERCAVCPQEAACSVVL